MESSKMVQSLIGLRTLSQNWFRHFVAFQWNESDLCWLWCWFMRWDNLLLVKYSDLHTLSNVSTWSRFTHFLVFWLDLAIYALCRILMKCRDLRIFPGTNYRFPGTKNFSTPLATVSQQSHIIPATVSKQLKVAHTYQSHATIIMCQSKPASPDVLVWATLTHLQVCLLHISDPATVQPLQVNFVMAKYEIHGWKREMIDTRIWSKVRPLE